MGWTPARRRTSWSWLEWTCVGLESEGPRCSPCVALQPSAVSSVAGVYQARQRAGRPLHHTAACRVGPFSGVQHGAQFLGRRPPAHILIRAAASTTHRAAAPRSSCGAAGMHQSQAKCIRRPNASSRGSRASSCRGSSSDKGQGRGS